MTFRTRFTALCALLAACSEGGIGSGQHAQCRPDPERVLYVREFAPCPGSGTAASPYCRVGSALALIRSDECTAPWVIDAQGSFAERLEFNNDIRETGPPRVPPSVNVTIIGGTFGGGAWALDRTLVMMGSNVSLTLDTVVLRNTAEDGIQCGWDTTGSLLRLRNVRIDRVRTALRTTSGCGLDAEGLTVDTAFGGVAIGGEYRVRRSAIVYSAGYSALLQFENGARGEVDGLTFRNNITRNSLIDCGQLPRELRHLDIIHRGTVFADETTCKTFESTVEILP